MLLAKNEKSVILKADSFFMHDQNLLQILPNLHDHVSVTNLKRNFLHILATGRDPPVCHMLETYPISFQTYMMSYKNLLRYSICLIHK